MMNRGLRALLFVQLLWLPLKANASEFSLEEVWRAISVQSKSQQAANLEFQAASVASDRASLHWLPRVYLDAKSFETNDPGLSFFGILSQRSVTSADFDPSLLNHPSSQLFTRGALGIDLPLYEGGMKIAQEEMQGHIKASKGVETSLIKIAQYAEIARVYGVIGGLVEQKEKLEDLQASLNRLLRSYQLGSKSNPVGYSGLLGLKTLANRIQGLLSENRAKATAGRKELVELGFTNDSWTPIKSKIIDFVDRYFPPPQSGDSPKVLAHQEMAMAAQSRANMEKARYLPKVGAFAEEYVFNGNRSTENGYSAGLYLQWSLYSPSDSGVAKEARLNASASELKASAMAQQDRAESAGIAEAMIAIRENLKLMEESDSLLSEQTRVAADLFKNGSINALQLVEALSRRADLISSHTDAQINLLKLAAEQATKINFRFPASVEETNK
jgi:Outer membrane efflux protein